MDCSATHRLIRSRYSLLLTAACLLAFFAISSSTAVLEEDAQAAQTRFVFDEGLININCDKNRPPIASEIKMTPKSAGMHWPVGTYTVPFYAIASVDVSDDNVPLGIEPTSIGEVYLAPQDGDPEDPNVWVLKQREQMSQFKDIRKLPLSDTDVHMLFVDMEWPGQYKIVIQVTDACGEKVTLEKTGIQAIL